MLLHVILYYVLRLRHMPRVGRVNFSKVVEESDPKVLRHFKHIVEARPLKIITGKDDDSEKGEYGAEHPLLASWLFSAVRIERNNHI